MSNRLFPSTIQSLVNKARLLSIAFAPQGAQSAGALTGGFANIPSPAGVKSVVYNSTGNYTINLQNAFRSLISANGSLQLATGGATGTSASITSGTGTAGLILTAGSAMGSVGDSMTLTVTQGTVAAVSSNGLDITVTLPTAGETAATAEAAINAALPSSFVVASLVSSGAGTLLAHSKASFTGAQSSTTAAVITAANVTAGGTGPQSVTVQFQDVSSGAAVDVAANAGNLYNLLLLVKDSAY